MEKGKKSYAFNMWTKHNTRTLRAQININKVR